MSSIDDMHAERRMKEEEYLNLRIAHFIKRYRPDHIDERAAVEFEADLIGLIRAAHMQATEPFVRRYNVMLDALPTFSFTPEKKG